LLLIGIPLLFIALATLPAGPTIVCLAQLKGQPWTFGDFFAALRRMWPYIAGELLLSPLIVLPFLPLFLMGVVMALVGPRDVNSLQPYLGICSALVMLGVAGATFYVWFRLAIFSRQLIADRGFGAIQALKGSWELTRGHFWGLFGTLLLILVLVYLSGLFTLGIGLLFTLPRALLVLNAGYLEISRARLGSSGTTEASPPPQTGTVPAAPGGQLSRAWLATALVLGVLLFGSLGVNVYVVGQPGHTREKEMRLLKSQAIIRDLDRALSAARQDARTARESLEQWPRRLEEAERKARQVERKADESARDAAELARRLAAAEEKNHELSKRLAAGPPARETPPAPVKSAFAREVRRLEKQEAATAFNPVFAPDGKKALTSGEKGDVFLWDVGTGKLLHRFTGHDGERVTALAFAPDGSRFLSTGMDGRALVWDVENRKEVVKFEGHRDAAPVKGSRPAPVFHAQFSPDGKRALSCGLAAAWLWDATTGKKVRQLETGGATCV
jgi:hypothetical protein